MGFQKRKDLENYLLSPDFNGIKSCQYTWNELGEIYGFSGEAVRAMWKRMRKIKPNLSKNASLVEFCKENNIDPSTVKQAKYITHSGQNTFNVTIDPNSLRKTIMLEIEESIKKTFADFEPTITYNPVHKGDDKIAILNITDLHIGMDIPSSFYGYEWNKEMLFEKLTEMCSVFKEKMNSFNPQSIILNVLGDVTDGQDGSTTRGLKRAGNILPQNMTNSEMYNNALDFFKELIINLTDYQLPVAINFVTNSNHGGLLDYTIGKTLKELCNIQYPGLEFNLNTSFISSQNLENIDILTTHGYDEGLQNKFNRMPLHLNQSWLLKINNVKERYNCKNKTCLLFRGDLHRANICSYQRFEDIMIPPFSPPSDYSQSNYDNDITKSGFTIVKVEGSQYELLNYYFD